MKYFFPFFILIFNCACNKYQNIIKKYNENKSGSALEKIDKTIKYINGLEEKEYKEDIKYLKNKGVDINQLKDYSKTKQYANLMKIQNFSKDQVNFLIENNFNTSLIEKIDNKDFKRICFIQYPNKKISEIYFYTGKLLGKGGAKVAIEIKNLFGNKFAILLPNTHEIIKKNQVMENWNKEVDIEVEVSKFLTKYNIPNPHSIKVQFYSMPQYRYGISAYISDSFDELEKKDRFIVDMKNKNRWQNKSSFIKNKIHRNDTNLWIRIFERILNDYIILYGYGIELDIDNENFIIERNNGEMTDKILYYPRYFGFDFSTKNGYGPNIKKIVINDFIKSNLEKKLFDVVEFIFTDQRRYDELETDKKIKNLKEKFIVEKEKEYFKKYENEKNNESIDYDITYINKIYLKNFIIKKNKINLLEINKEDKYFIEELNLEINSLDDEEDSKILIESLKQKKNLKMLEFFKNFTQKKYDEELKQVLLNNAYEPNQFVKDVDLTLDFVKDILEQFLDEVKEVIIKKQIKDIIGFEWKTRENKLRKKFNANNFYLKNSSKTDIYKILKQNLNDKIKKFNSKNFKSL